MKTPISFKSGDQALVLGLGRSGEAAARLLLALGARVTVIDSENTSALAARAERLRQEGASVIVGGTVPPDRAFTLAVASPGIPVEAPLLAGISRRGVPMIPELELGWECCRGRILAITGSSGKSTLAKLCRDALQACGQRVAIGANYGTPLAELVRVEAPADWYVLEVSSFQLELANRFRPDIAILLNLFPNHLDRHHTMEAYTAAKMRIFRNMRPNDHALIHGILRPLAATHVPGRGHWITFGTDSDDDIRYQPGRIGGDGSDGYAVDLRGTIFDNPVLGVAAAATAGALRAAGFDPRVLDQVASRFEPLPHRMQTVAAIKGVRFINDSKATALMAMAAALTMVGGKTRLIAGGRLKETDLMGVKNILAGHVEKIYLVGESSSVLAAAWGDCVSCVVCGNLDRAVKSAWQDAREGDTVLLAPGCASFDQFSGFEERGMRFIEIVTSLER